MTFNIRQVTTYRYPSPVYLEPHVVRLRPQSGPSQTVMSWDLAIDPAPTTLTWAIDGEGNCVAYAWFEGLTDELRLVSQFEAETHLENTFDFLWLDECDRLGFEYSERDALQRFLGKPPSPLELTWEALAGGDGSTSTFLTSLNQSIHKLMRVVIREDCGPYPPEETLNRGEGACRDLAWLFVSCCREAGLAARFVSGYQAGDIDSQDRYLHAWAEVYLPGGGWRGFDPTLGLAVANQHVAIAAAAKPIDAAPVAGSFRGAGAKAQLETILFVETAPWPSIRSPPSDGGPALA